MAPAQTEAHRQQAEGRAALLPPPVAALRVAVPPTAARPAALQLRPAAAQDAAVPPVPAAARAVPRALVGAAESQHSEAHWQRAERQARAVLRQQVVPRQRAELAGRDRAIARCSTSISHGNSSWATPAARRRPATMIRRGPRSGCRTRSACRTSYRRNSTPATAGIGSTSMFPRNGRANGSFWNSRRPFNKPKSTSMDSRSANTWVATRDSRLTPPALW